MIGPPWSPYFMPLVWMVFSLFGILLTIWVSYLAVDSLRRRHQLRSNAEFQTRLLERIGSAREFGEFISSPEGERFLQAIAPRERLEPRIFRSVQAAAVTLLVGIAIFIYADVSESSLGGGIHDLLNLVAAISTATGLGLAISAAVSMILWRRLQARDPAPRGRQNSSLV